jgi:glycosyltransferase involved in cell wall biosynthesis
VNRSTPEYTIVFPPTMLWTNHQRPHHVLTQLARHHPVRCLFNDWTVKEERFEEGRLIVTKHAFRRRYHSGPLVYYFSIPEKLDYLWRPFLRPDLLVFELMDLPEEEFAGWKKKLPRALARADLVRTTHPAITDYLQERYADALGGKPVSTSYNGVDLDLFDADVRYDRPPELVGVDRPVLGFYGNLDGWIDWELIGALAALPEYQVVVVGGTEGMAPRIPAELRESSVLWVGKRPVSEMPRFLAHFDVALYPFVVNEMTDAVDPLKVWEYLAFGRPVLASPTRLVRDNPSLFEPLDPADLAGSVRRALATRDDPAAIERRKAAARRRDWRTVADALHAEIMAALREASRNP